MNFKQIECVSEIVRTKSFTLAAKNLFISQPALSSQIKSLEQELGFKLFVRNIKKPIELTDAGRIFIAHARKIDSDLSRLRLALGRLETKNMGEIRMGLFLAFGYTGIGKTINLFRRLNPNVLLQFKIGLSNDLISDLRKGSLDTAIVIDSYPGSLPQNKRFSYYLVSQSELALITSKANPLALYEYITLNDLDDEPVIMVDGHSPMYRTLQDNIKALDACPRVIGQSSQADVVLQIAECNIASGFLSVDSFRHCQSEKAVAIPIYPHMSRDVYYICNKESQNYRFSLSFRDFLINNFNDTSLNIN